MHFPARQRRVFALHSESNFLNASQQVISVSVQETFFEGWDGRHIWGEELSSNQLF